MMNDELTECLAAAELRLDRAMFEKESLDRQCDALAKEIDRLRIEIAVGEMMANDFDDSLVGENMTTSRLLANALNRQDLGVRRSFERLEEHEKAEVEALYRRHAAACHKGAMPPEPSLCTMKILKHLKPWASWSIRRFTCMAASGHAVRGF
jgi:hypothetical protein